MDEKDYKVVFEKIVNDLTEYVRRYKLKAMVLGISGGIDSTVCAAICHEVSKKTGIPLIGRSLTIKNKADETSAASLVGEAFCNDFKELNLIDLFNDFADTIRFFEQDIYGENWTNPIADGNIQARLRMIYLYHLAGINKGIVIDTDNLSENGLGFFTLHGDVGDYKPIGNLWKTEVYKLAEYLTEKYKYNSDMKIVGVQKSIELTPTDGLGISSSDLEQIGADSYDDVDVILCELDKYRSLSNESIDVIIAMVKGSANIHSKLRLIDGEVIDKVCQRYKNGEFKRRPIPKARIE